MSKRGFRSSDKSTRPHGRRKKGDSPPRPPRRQLAYVPDAPKKGRQTRRSRSQSPEDQRPPRFRSVYDNEDDLIDLPHESPDASPRGNKRVGSPLFGADFLDEDGYYVASGPHKGFRVVPSNGLLKTREVKHADYEATRMEVHAYTAALASHYREFIFTSVTDVTQGFAHTDRVGDTIHVVRIALRFYWSSRWTYAVNAIAPPPAPQLPHYAVGHNVRLCVIRDKQSNGVDPSVTLPVIFQNALNTWNIGQFRDTSLNQRYEILYDEIHHIKFQPPVTYTQEIATIGEAFAWFGEWFSPVTEVFLDTDFDVRFSADTIGPTEVVDNNVFVVAFPFPMDFTVPRHQVPYLENIMVRTSFIDK